MTLAETDIATLTVMFILIVASLGAALVVLFCTLEQSMHLTRLRVALVRRSSGGGSGS